MILILNPEKGFKEHPVKRKRENLKRRAMLY
jgi:hypothetical protein